MAGPISRSDPKGALEALIAEARRIRDEYETAFEAYKSKSAVNRLLGALGVEAAYEYFDVSRRTGGSAVSAFLKTWEMTPEYRRIRTQFEMLMVRVRGLLLTVSQRAPSLRPPGDSHRLLALLKPVGEAKRLDTKMSRLLAALEDLETRPLTYNHQIPVPRVRVNRTQPKKSSPDQARPEEALAWTLVVTFITIFLAVTFGLVSLLGWELAVVIGLAAGAVTVTGLAVTRMRWVPVIARRLARER